MIILPADVVVAKEFKKHSAAPQHSRFGVKDDEMILDVGPASVQEFINRLQTTATLVWNGPLGAFETPPFDHGTIAPLRSGGGADPGRAPRCRLRAAAIPLPRWTRRG